MNTCDSKSAIGEVSRRNSFTYKKAGVDINKSNYAKKRIKLLCRKTFTKNVLKGIGGFGGFFQFDRKSFINPVFVSSSDGVGTKLKVAVMMNKYDTVGIDLVNHCINDILVHGAKPLFFLDYIAMSKLDPDVVSEIVEGLSVACCESGCALIGGETAEMPGVYNKGEIDLVGFIVGIVEKKKIIYGENIKRGDIVIGFKSNGLHTNGYSLARKLVFEKAKYRVNDHVKELNTTIGNELLKIHRCYLKPVSKIIGKYNVKGIAHITGGGLLENIPRIIPEGLQVNIYKGTWNILPVFGFLQAIGNVPEYDMYRTFNMGIGLVVIVSEKDKFKIMDELISSGENPSEIGKISVKNNRKSPVVLIC